MSVSKNSPPPDRKRSTLIHKSTNAYRSREIMSRSLSELANGYQQKVVGLNTYTADPPMHFGALLPRHAAATAPSPPLLYSMHRKNVTVAKAESPLVESAFWTASKENTSYTNTLDVQYPSRTVPLLKIIRGSNTKERQWLCFLVTPSTSSAFSDESLVPGTL